MSPVGADGVRSGRPPGTAPCLDQPCSYPGRGGSGLCRTHYKALWQRTWRFRRLLGTDLTIAAICDVTARLRAQDALAEEVLGVLHRLMRSLERGTLLVTRNGQLAQRMAGREGRCRVR